MINGYDDSILEVSSEIMYNIDELFDLLRISKELPENAQDAEAFIVLNKIKIEQERLATLGLKNLENSVREWRKQNEQS